VTGDFDELLPGSIDEPLPTGRQTGLPSFAKMDLCRPLAGVGVGVRTGFAGVGAGFTGVGADFTGVGADFTGVETVNELVGTKGAVGLGVAKEIRLFTFR
jgi:hypothetical protein